MHQQMAKPANRRWHGMFSANCLQGCNVCIENFPGWMQRTDHSQAQLFSFLYLAAMMQQLRPLKTRGPSVELTRRMQRKHPSRRCVHAFESLQPENQLAATT
mmetsp:Transcript_30856/g.79261  ORF Transcript_30856/g.79261 Transcript_30856/m.79261 type:complete len:102 (-) Transcript_30856:28-333(-)